MGEPILTFVFARYKEDMAPVLATLPAGVKVDVWTKDVDLPNIGREPNTYFNYIIKNYDTLSGYYIFSQPKPFDHVPLWSGWVKVYSAAPRDFEWVGKVWTCRGDGTAQDSNVPVDACYQLIYEGKKPCPEFYTFNEGCIFGVSAERIKQRPKEYYEKLLQFNDNAGPKAPWAFERLWADVFHENS